MNLSYLSCVVVVGLAGAAGFQAWGNGMRESVHGEVSGSVVAVTATPALGGSSQAAGLGWMRHLGKLEDTVQLAVRAEMAVLEEVANMERAFRATLDGFGASPADKARQTRILKGAERQLTEFRELVESAGLSYQTRDFSTVTRLEERLADRLAQGFDQAFARMLRDTVPLDGELPVRKTEGGIPRVTIDPREGRFVHVTGVSDELDPETLARVRKFYDALEEEISFYDLQLEIALPGDNTFRADAIRLIDPTDIEPFRLWVGQEVDAELADYFARNGRLALAAKLGQPQFQDGVVSKLASDLDAELAALTGGVDPRVARLEAIRHFQSEINAKRPGETPHLELFKYLFPDHDVQFLGGVDHGKGGPLYARFTRDQKLGNVLELRGDITAPGAVDAQRMVDLVDRQARYGDALLDNGVELHVTLQKGANEEFGGRFEGNPFIDVGIDHEAPDAVLRAVLERAQELDN